MALLLRVMLLGLAAIALVRAQLSSDAQTPFTLPLGNDSHGARPAFTPETMLEVPRLSTLTANPSGTVAAFLVSQLDLAKDKTSHSLQVINLDAGSSLLPLELEVPEAGEMFWYDDSTLIFSVPNSTTRTTALYAHYISPVISNLLPGEHIGILPTDSATGFQYSYAAQTLVFSDYVFPDGNLSKAVENDRAWIGRKDTALSYDGSTFVRIFDKYTSPKQSSLFSVHFTVNWEGRWTLGDAYTNLLAGSNHHTPVEGMFGERNDFKLSGLLVAYTAKDPALAQAYHSKQNVYLVDVFGQTAPRELTSGAHGTTASPVLSPDSQRVAWLEISTDGNLADKAYVVVYDLIDESRVVLLEDWDRSPTGLSFSSDGRSLYITAPEMARVRIFAYPLFSSASTPSEPLRINDDGAATALQPLPNGRLLFKQETIGNPGDVYVLENPPGTKETRKRQLTYLSREGLKGIEVPKTTEFTFKGAENRTVHGFVVNPTGWSKTTSKNRTWPVVFVIHGGPEYFTGDEWNTITHPYIFAHRGYFFVAVNPTGSISFGQELTEAINGDWGGAPFVDMRKGFQHALDMYPEIDPDRAVAWGASYGGYAINWIQSNPEFGFGFKALLCFAGIFDVRYLAYTIDLNYFMNHEWTGRPWQNATLEKFASQSPSNFVHKWSTPELVMHGDIDFRVPVTEGIAAFSALQQRGVPSRLIIFKEEPHGLRKPHNLLIYYDEMFRWFDCYVSLGETNC